MFFLYDWEPEHFGTESYPMVSMIPVFILGCASTAMISPPPPIPKPQTSSLNSDLTYHILLAYMMESQGREFEQAEAEWKKAITYSHCNPEIHLAYADMAHRYNRIDIALKQWERSIICIGWKDQNRRQQIQQRITLYSYQ